MGSLSDAVREGLAGMLDAAGSAPPVYVTGPYAAKTHEDIVINTTHAVRVGHLCGRLTGAPVLVPHAMGLAGLYGESGDDGTLTEVRARALQQGRAWAALSGRLGGALVVILQPDGKPSSGTAEEITAFQRAGGQRMLQGKYLDLLEAMTWEHIAREVGVILPPPAAGTQLCEEVRALWPRDTSDDNP